MKKLIISSFAKLIPNIFRKQLKNFKVLSMDLGQWQSIKENVPIDKQGDPIPWYTYPAIEYLRRLDIVDKIIFEWGAGNSSLFWATKAKEVVSVEDNKKWFSIINEKKLNNQKLIFCEKKSDYTKEILNQNRKFDVIVIDGKHRYDCAKNVLGCVSKKGLIILDNSDRHPKTSQILKGQNLIQVDFNGFGPVNNYTWTTSLFFTRDFDFKFKQSLRPEGGLKQNAEE
ncbi:MAG: SAM-dependent methyltransferase [Candidatus Pacebacteria bacterium]|nr:SAM-dependent methyltransferase [Candidatus Paceibacterota bacterium]